MSFIRTGVNQPNIGGTLYPYVNYWAENANVLVDLRVGYDDKVHKAPFRVQTLADLGTTPHVVIIDADGQTVIDTTTVKPPITSTWNTYTVVKWYGAPYGLSIVFDGEVLAAGGNISPPTPQEIDMRCLEPNGIGVTKLQVFNKDGLILVEPGASALVKWRPGYNTYVDAVLPPGPVYGGALRKGQATIHMRAGGGLGKHNGCDDSENSFVRALTGASADAVGNITVSSDECLRVQPLITFEDDKARIQPGVIVLADDCEACCDCEEYEAVYRGVYRTKRRLSNVLKVSNQLTSRYESARSYMAPKLSCLTEQSILRLQASSIGQNTFGISVGLHNPTKGIMKDVQLKVVISQVFSNGTATEVITAAGSKSVPLMRNKLASGYGSIEQLAWAQKIDVGCVEAGEAKFGVARIIAGVSGLAQVCVSLHSWDLTDTNIIDPQKICLQVPIGS
jgi:hypothetical protein